MVVIAARGQEAQLIADLAGELEAEDVAVEGDGALEVDDVAGARGRSGRRDGSEFMPPSDPGISARDIGDTPKTVPPKAPSPLVTSTLRALEQLDDRDREIEAMARVLGGGGAGC